MVDYLHVSWQNALQHGTGPPLQGLRKHSVVGVGTSADRDVPSLLPAQPLNVNKDAHQLRNSQRRMSVVKLNCYFVWECIKVGADSLLASEFG